LIDNKQTKDNDRIPAMQIPQLNRRFLRFRIRTVLIGMTVVALSCAYFTKAWQDYEREQRAISRISRLQISKTASGGQSIDKVWSVLANTCKKAVAWSGGLKLDDAVAAAWNTATWSPPNPLYG
jgi:hypothetical protein